MRAGTALLRLTLAGTALLAGGCGGSGQPSPPEAATSSPSTRPVPTSTAPGAGSEAESAPPPSSAALLPPPLPLKFDFSERECPFVQRDEPEFSLACADGVYRIDLRSATPAGARSGFMPDAFALRVEADGRASGNAHLAFGLVCWHLEDGYHFLVAMDGTWAVLEETVAERRVLAEGAGAHLLDQPAPNRLRADCIGVKRGGRDTALLVFTVNGERIATVEDREPSRSFKGIVFGWVGVSAFPFAEGGSAEFDDFAARRLRAD